MLSAISKRASRPMRSSLTNATFGIEKPLATFPVTRGSGPARGGDKAESEFGGHATQGAKAAGAEALVVGRLADFLIGLFALEHAIEELSDLVRRGRDRLGSPDASTEPSVEGTESGFGVAQGASGKSEGCGRPLGTRFRARAHHPAAGFSRVGSQPQPGAKGSFTAPSGQVSARFGKHSENRVGSHSSNGGQIDTGHLEAMTLG